MRLARKLFLIAVAAIAALAVSAPAANAVTVSAEDGDPCPEVQVDNSHNVTGGCAIEASTVGSSTADLRGHFPGVGEAVVSQCTNDFDARIHASGDAWIYNQALNPVGVPCNIQPCDEAAPSHANYEWPATVMEFGSVEALQVTFCTRPFNATEGTGQGTCTVFIPLSEPSSHSYLLTTLAPGPATPAPPPAAPLQSRCSQNAAVSLTGQWQIHDTPIEITH